jgi:hypothetical protein
LKSVLLLILVICLSSCATHSSSSRNPVLVNPSRLPLEVLPGEFSWCKVTSNLEISKLSQAAAELLVLVQSPEGQFIVVSADSVPPSAECIEKELKAVRLVPTPDPIVGTIATVTHTFAVAGISVEVVTTGETDYFLFSAIQFKPALDALRKDGYSVNTVK